MNLGRVVLYPWAELSLAELVLGRGVRNSFLKSQIKSLHTHGIRNFNAVHLGYGSTFR